MKRRAERLSVRSIGMAKSARQARPNGSESQECQSSRQSSAKHIEPTTLNTLSYHQALLRKGLPQKEEAGSEGEDYRLRRCFSYSLKQRIHKTLGVESRDVVGLLAGADVQHG